MISMSKNKPRLLLPEDYLKSATEDIKKAKSHIYILTMIIANDEVLDPFIEALGEAARRGLTVNVAADMFTYAEIGGHFKFHTSRNPKIKSASTLRKRLAKSGVSFRWLGKSASSIVNGRTHCKWVVIDNTAYSFGGTNLYAEGIRNTDYMLRIEDSELATHLINAQQKFIRADRNNHVHHSKKFTVRSGVVLLDGGMLGDSVIYRRACQLTSKAKKVTYVSQYCPTGRLGRLLKKTENKLYFNHWNKASSINALTIRLGSWFSGHKTIYDRPKYLHAKLMLFEMHDGSKVALSGSHNFSHGGVWLGTRENTLETTDTRIIRQLESFIEEHVT